MKILVVGGGGREHAIIKKLKENPAVTEIFALPGNGGISADATSFNGLKKGTISGKGAINNRMSNFLMGML